MALTLDVNGVHLAFGLNWASAPTGRGKSGQVADLGVRFRASHKVFLSAQGQYGFMEAGGRLRGGVKKGSAVSGAALFASLVPDGQDSILVHLAEAKKKAIIVVVADGLIYQDVVISLGNGLDKSDSGVMREDGTFKLSEEAALRKVQEKIDQIYNETGKEFVPFGNFYQVFPQSKQMDLDMLLEGDIGAASLSKFTDHRPAIKIAAVCLVLFGAMWGFQEHQKREKKRKEMLARQAQVDPMDVYRKNLKKVLAKARYSAAEADQTLLAPMLARDVEVGGWALQKLTCTNLGGCEERWASINGTAKSFAQANKVVGEVGKYSNSLDSFSFTYNLEGKVSPLDPGTLPQLNDFSPKAVQVAQELAEEGVAVTWNKEPALFGLTAGVTAKTVKKGEGVARTAVEVTGPIGLAGKAMGLLPENLMVSDVSLQYGDDLESHKFSIKGYYYVKK